MRPPPLLTVLIPAFNEAERIGATLDALAGLASVVPSYALLVIDDGSWDETAAVAQEKATVIRLPRNEGKGAALNAGLEAAEASEYLLLLDADLGTTAAQAVRLVRPLLEGAADLTIATFPVIPGKGGGMGLVVRLARWGIFRATGQRMAAPLSGQRAMRRSVLRTVGGMEAGFGVEVGMTLDALAAGFRVLEIPTEMTHRVTGRDWRAMRHRAGQLLAVARVLWRRRGLLLRPVRQEA